MNVLQLLNRIAREPVDGTVRALIAHAWSDWPMRCDLSKRTRPTMPKKAPRMIQTNPTTWLHERWLHERVDPTPFDIDLH